MTKQQKMKCVVCGKVCGGDQGLDDHYRAKHPEYTILEADDPQTRPDWKHSCDVCGQKPIVPLTGMCGPCTFGEADTAGGNW